MAVGGNNVEFNGKKRGTSALKLVVTVDVADVETACGVPFDGVAELAEDGGLRAVWHRTRRAETDAAGDGVEKGSPCTKKKSAQMVTFQWCSKMGGGIGLATNVGALGAAADRVALPFITATSGP